jgi:hypothetical protein
MQQLEPVSVLILENAVVEMSVAVGVKDLP